MLKSMRSHRLCGFGITGRDSSHTHGNNKRATALTLMVGNVGEGKMPAFIGLPGAREKTESGRGLFERSEFRSPVGERSGEAGIPDNGRATFLGYFFVAGKKLQTIVILTTVGEEESLFKRS